LNKTALAFLVIFCTVAAIALAGDPQAQTMSPEEQKMMEIWAQAMKPGPQHKELAAMAGTWEFKGTFWMDPSAPPSQSAGTAERVILLGGRVLQEKVTSSMMGQPFEGMGLTGYDNITGEYWSTWNDNMSTGIMMATGKCTKDKCEFIGTYSDAQTGGTKKSRMISHCEPDKEVHEMFDIGPYGKEFKTMELVYTRKK
jgi:hypothetical protein